MNFKDKTLTIQAQRNAERQKNIHEVASNLYVSAPPLILRPHPEISVNSGMP